jgi:hypothetical protein
VEPTVPEPINPEPNQPLPAPEPETTIAAKPVVNPETTEAKPMPVAKPESHCHTHVSRLTRLTQVDWRLTQVDWRLTKG